jgi:hypothetical protein
VQSVARSKKKLIVSSLCCVAFLLPSAAIAGDGTIPKNFSVQFTEGGYFAPAVSIPPKLELGSVSTVLPPCTKEISNDCLLAVEYKGEDGKWRQGRYVEPIPIKDLQWDNSYAPTLYTKQTEPLFAKADLERNFPGGGMTGIWNLPNAKHGGGTRYAVNFSIFGVMGTSPSDSKTPTVLWNHYLDTQINPVSYSASDSRISCGAAFGKARFNCAWTENHPFPKNVTFRLVAKLDKTKSILEKSNWYLGRLQNAFISRSEMGDSVVFSLEGGPVTLGTAQSEFEKTEANFAIYHEAYRQSMAVRYGSAQVYVPDIETLKKGTGGGFSTTDPGTLEAWEIIDKHFPLVLLTESDSWRVRSTDMSPSDLAVVSQCSGKEKILGLVSTNAIAGNPRPPTWDPEFKELNYKVASTHLKLDKTVNSGTYELAVSENLARCLWSDDVSQYKVSISVLSKDGSEKLSTAIFTRRKGYFVFRVKGFTYSTSLIKLKLGEKLSGAAIAPSAESETSTAIADLVALSNTESAQLEVEPEVTAAAKSKEIPVKSATKATSVVKKITITCKKGKITKKVNGFVPKCPAGYKKVS